MFNAENLKRDLTLVREKNPLIENITNYVAMNFNANALLALGASPVMANAIEEMEDIVAIASATTINMGTVDSHWLPSMLKAGQTAHALGKPLVFDPVGVGASKYRSETAWLIINETHPTIIRGNASEIMALINSDVKSKGVDSSMKSDDAVESAKMLAKRTGAVVVVSGEVDYVTDGERVGTVRNGSSMMPLVTAMGCTATCVLGAFAAVNPDAFEAALHGMFVMGVCGELAAAGAAGPGTLLTRFVDELYVITPEKLALYARP